MFSLALASPEVSLLAPRVRETFGEARFALAEREAKPSVMRSDPFSLVFG